MPIDPIIGGAAIGAASNALGLIGQKKREKRAVANQKDLNQHGQEMAVKTWNETSYPAQMAKMKEAGLNPALMYGQGGGAGGTTNSGSGGSAPAPQPMNVEGISQGAEAISRTLLNKATAGKTSEEARKLKRENDYDEVYKDKYEASRGSGYDQNIISGERANTEWEWEKAAEYGYDADGGSEEGKGVHNKTSPKYRQYIAGVVGTEIENQLKGAKTNLTKEQADKLFHDIVQGYINSGSKAIGEIGGLVTKGLSKIGSKGNGSPGKWRKNE